ncbi:D-alanine--D-alanine ligase [Mucilaginibacter sp. BJC16-A38]|uniref:D-alanine--D-alanine ligase family protein n=1 Tax=Mucilaginibacter phenanthrenivorans TaxID=1234842 RepID=UPI0021581624|nr:D-alanine--D-alanine ligase family protein [Mucilaginibacter phenanthrenivorans]MCR8559513.1 D-alanine--D-alanine ligase [Mucilaginibacter phenanthrenivorans]
MKIKVGVIFGGRSVEHEISVISAQQAIAAFDKNNYEITPIYITKTGKWYTGDALLNVDNYKNTDNLLAQCTEIYLSPAYGDFTINAMQSSIWKSKELGKIDIAFPIIHGTNGEDGSLQGLLELKGIPYVGCDVLSSAIGMDKIMMKMVLKESKLPVVDYTWFTDRSWHLDKETIIENIKKIGFPVIVKPSNLGSSVGVSKAADEAALIDAVELASRFSARILVERMVTDLKEINCSVIGDSANQSASVCEEPLGAGDILSYKDKYITKGSSSKGMTSTKRQIPANIPKEQAMLIQDLAKETFRVLSCSGVSRIDFLVDKKDNKVYVNEINTIPGSLSFYLWEATDKNFGQLLKTLIDVALKRQRERDNLIVSYGENIFNMSAGLSKSGKS